MILIFICKNLSPECWLNFNIADFFIELVIILNVDTPFTQFYQEKVDSEESRVPQYVYENHELLKRTSFEVNFGRLRAQIYIILT